MTTDGEMDIKLQLDVLNFNRRGPTISLDTAKKLVNDLFPRKPPIHWTQHNINEELIPDITTEEITNAVLEYQQSYYFRV